MIGNFSAIFSKHWKRLRIGMRSHGAATDFDQAFPNHGKAPAPEGGHSCPPFNWIRRLLLNFHVQLHKLNICNISRNPIGYRFKLCIHCRAGFCYIVRIP